MKGQVPGNKRRSSRGCETGGSKNDVKVWVSNVRAVLAGDMGKVETGAVERREHFNGDSVVGRVI